MPEATAVSQLPPVRGLQQHPRTHQGAEPCRATVRLRLATFQPCAVHVRAFATWVPPSSRLPLGMPQGFGQRLSEEAPWALQLPTPQAGLCLSWKAGLGHCTLDHLQRPSGVRPWPRIQPQEHGQHSEQREPTWLAQRPCCHHCPHTGNLGKRLWRRWLILTLFTMWS